MYCYSLVGDTTRGGRSGLILLAQTKISSSTGGTSICAIGSSCTVRVHAVTAVAQNYRCKHELLYRYGQNSVKRRRYQSVVSKGREKDHRGMLLPIGSTMMKLSCFAAAATALLLQSVQAGTSDHRYKKGEHVELWVNKVCSAPCKC